MAHFAVPVGGWARVQWILRPCGCTTKMWGVPSVEVEFIGGSWGGDGYRHQQLFR
jgi:hypothetical protein